MVFEGVLLSICPLEQRVFHCKMDLKKHTLNISYVMLCNVSCNSRCKVLVLSRYCTVDGTFLCLLCQTCKKVYCQFIYCF